ncbi:AAA family ATPase [Raoultella ornithinolytica]|uniref:AAA family ATPase n=1 Tax=Raoultella ornithinolytica TaxID=54291 RepID=UPI002FFBF0EC
MGKINTISMLDKLKDRKNCINLNGKNLIITGGNGSGKTRFLERLHKQLKLMASSNEHRISSEQYHMMIESAKSYLEDTQNPEPQKTERLIFSYMEKLNFLNDFEITLTNPSLFSHLMNHKNSYLCYFSATRMSDITNDGKVSSKKVFDVEYDGLMNDSNFDSGCYLEKYLVAIWVHSLLDKAIYNLDELGWMAKKINLVIDDLRVLFEDDSLDLKFNPNEFRMEIHQDGKEPFGFDSLSSGYSSILSIYANLFMRMNGPGVFKDEFSGIVIIDEIDVHLHVSLQKIIFPFLNKAFPNIQFIVSTHSPFVIQSVSDAVIYDMSSNEQMSDLSFYSYSSIVKGLLGEDDASDKLTALVNELLELTNNNEFNDRFDELVELIEKNKKNLDPRSRVSLALAQSKKMDAEG